MPADNGAPITAYHLYRRTSSTQSQLLATTGGDVTTYTDTAVPAGEQVFYRVTAESSYGESASCREVSPQVPVFTAADACATPGIQVAEDDAGDGTPATLDALSLSVAEPPQPDGVERIVFTVRMADLANPLPGNAWMILWNRPMPDATYDRDYVAMRIGLTGEATFEVGKISPPNLNQATATGSVDFGSYSPEDGTIEIGVSPEAIDGVAPGQDLAGLEVRTFSVSSSGLPVSQLAANDSTPAAIYTLQGNAQCLSNNPPVAVDDAGTTHENRPVKVAILSNDTDADGDPLRVTSISAPEHGRLLATKRTGIATYKPDGGFTGTDRFSYTIADGRGGFATATVTVTVVSP